MLSGQILPNYTYEDYTAWQGDWELIEGLPYAMTPAPNLKHQRISTRLARLLDESLDDCEACIATLAVDWKVDEHTVVQPDNLVTCHREEGQYLRKAPVLIFEILSESTADRDRVTKFELYRREGVRYYALVDPDARGVKIYRLCEGEYLEETDAGKEARVFDLGPCRITLDFARIWP